MSNYRVRIADDAETCPVSGLLSASEAAQLYVDAVSDRLRVVSTTVEVTDSAGSVASWPVVDGRVMPL